MLWKRIATAVVLAPIALALIWFGPAWAVGAIIALVLLLAAEEWVRLSALTETSWHATFTAVSAALLIAAFGLDKGSLIVDATLLLGCAWWVFAAGWLKAYPAIFRDGRVSPATAAASGWLMFSPAYLAVMLLHGHPGYSGPLHVLLLLALVWAADTGAYFAGHRFGRRKLAPSISPGKTWEGFVGGFVAAGLIAVLTGLFLLPTGAWGLPGFVLVCLVAVAFSVVGDLSISMFKRQANVKDTGQLLPGHGGILDRLDSLFAAAPVLALGLRWLGA